MRTLAVLLVLGLLLPLAPLGDTYAQVDDPLAEEEVSRPGETIAEAEARTREALANSNMKISVSAVGFDIPPGSEAEKYLQGTARAGGGGYFTANDAGELAEAMGAAAAGQTSIAGGGAQRIIITRPVDNDIVGPSIDVVGKAPPNSLVVLYTIVYPYGTDEQPKMVPGIRHRATATGDFSFRIATPRVSFGETNVRIRYAIRAHTLEADGTKGPETVVNVFSPEPTP